jgi:hypothetical protein
VACILVSGATLAAATLTPAALAGWTKYVGVTERRVEQELGAGERFLALDFGHDAAGKRRALLRGTVLIEAANAADGEDRPVDVPSALVHHWRGAVFIPNARLDALLARLQSGAPVGHPQDVLQSKVLERQNDRLRVFLRLQRAKFVTVVYNTEHTVTFRRYSATRASSTSTATKIAEIESPGTPQERELPPGHDRGFLWKWNSYWRYEEVAGGVIAECESVSLSRSVPSVVSYIAGPLIRSTARESMERTLLTLQRMPVR